MREGDKKIWDLRGPIKEDIPFIYKLWGDALFNGHTLSQGVGRKLSKQSWVQVIDRILESPETTIVVASPPEDIIVIYGIAIFQPKALHYIFTRQNLRKMGMGRSLAPHLFDKGAGDVSVTLRNQYIDAIMTKRPNIVYNPFLLFNIGG